MRNRCGGSGSDGPERAGSASLCLLCLPRWSFLTALIAVASTLGRCHCSALASRPLFLCLSALQSAESAMSSTIAVSVAPPAEAAAQSASSSSSSSSSAVSAMPPPSPRGSSERTAVSPPLCGFVDAMLTESAGQTTDADRSREERS